MYNKIEKRMKYHIFAGRFQPFHLGHLEIVKQSVSNLGENDVLVLAVVTSIDSGNPVIDNEFAKNAAEHHLPERNPWLPIVPLKAVTNLVSNMQQSGRILTMLLPAPDKSWVGIKKWFPEDRVWIIPDAGEEFDTQKAMFYKNQGEKIIRYSESTGISGREIREFYKDSDYDNFKKFIPSQIVDIYWKGERR